MKNASSQSPFHASPCPSSELGIKRRQGRQPQHRRPSPPPNFPRLSPWTLPVSGIAWLDSRAADCLCLHPSIAFSKFQMPIRPRGSDYRPQNTDHCVGRGRLPRRRLQPTTSIAQREKLWTPQEHPAPISKGINMYASSRPIAMRSRPVQQSMKA